MSILGILLCIFVTAANFATIPANNAICTTNSECPSNECCMLGPIRYAIPACKPLQPKGEQCRMNADTITRNLTYPDDSQIQVKNIHYILCPCANGLSCDYGTCK